MTLTTHHLAITAVATTPVALDEHSGSAIRGAIANALWGRFCTNQAAPTCAACPLVAACPVAALVAPMREDDQPGSDQRPRPYVIEPPLGGARTYAPGERFTFGLGVFGSAAALFPYLVMAARELERDGLGRKLPGHGGRRGQIRIAEIAATHPLSGARQLLYTDGIPQVHAPALPVTAADVAAHAAQLPTDRLTFQFHTPLRIIEQDRLLQRFALRPLLQRLMRRLDDLASAYGDGPLRLDFRQLLTIAEGVHITDDQTRWVDVASVSARHQRRTPIGGLIGQATVGGDLAPLRELLVWGQLVHAGRNAVKGSGWYTVRGAPDAARRPPPQP